MSLYFFPFWEHQLSKKLQFRNKEHLMRTEVTTRPEISCAYCQFRGH